MRVNTKQIKRNNITEPFELNKQSFYDELNNNTVQLSQLSSL